MDIYIVSFCRLYGNVYITGSQWVISPLAHWDAHISNDSSARGTQLAQLWGLCLEHLVENVWCHRTKHVRNMYYWNILKQIDCLVQIWSAPVRGKPLDFTQVFRLFLRSMCSQLPCLSGPADQNTVPDGMSNRIPNKMPHRISNIYTML